MRALLFNVNCFASRQFYEAFNVKPRKKKASCKAETTMKRHFVVCQIATKSPVERDGATYDKGGDWK